MNRLRPGAGYAVLFAAYGVLFLLSAVALVPVRATRPAQGTGSGS